MMSGLTRDSPRSQRLALIAIAVLAIAAYVNCVSAPFLFDDYTAIVTNPTIRHFGEFSQVLVPPTAGIGVTGRPVVNLSLAINYAFGGTTVSGYHVLNVALHVCAGLALFGLVRRTLLAPVLRERFRAIALPFAFAVAALWTLHPLQTESVTCIVQRTEVLAGLFYLLTLYCLVRSTDDAHPGLWAGLAVAACLTGMASKEIMVSAPLLALLHDRTFVAGSFRDAWRLRRKVYVGLGATWLLLFYLVASGGGTRGEAAGFGLGVSPYTYAVKQCEAVTHYLWLGLWPHPLVLDYGESLAIHPVGIWQRGLLLALLVGVTVHGLWRRPVVGFIGCWFFAILAPSSSVVPLLTQTVAEHRMYLPLAAEIVALAAGVAFLFPHRKALWFGALIAACAVLTARRNADYRSTITIWQDTVAKVPANSRAHHNLGVELAREPGRSADAIVCFRRALACKADDITAHYSLAHELARIPGERESALRHYAAALSIDARHANAQLEFATELAKDPARLSEAIPHFEAAIRLKPESSVALNNFASALSARPEGAPVAKTLYRRALEIARDDPAIHFNLANLLATAPAEAPEAALHYEQAVRLQPSFFEAHFRFANLLGEQLGRDDDAIAQYLAALQLNPGHFQSRYNLGVLHANRGRIAEAIRHFEAALSVDPSSTDTRKALEMLRARLR